MWMRLVVCLILALLMPADLRGAEVEKSLPEKAKERCLQRQHLPKLPMGWNAWSYKAAPGADKRSSGRDADLMMQPGIAMSGKRMTSACAVIECTTSVKTGGGSELANLLPTIVANQTVVRVFDDRDRAKDAYKAWIRNLRRVADSSKLKSSKVPLPENIDEITSLHADWREQIDAGTMHKSMRVFFVLSGRHVGMFSTSLVDFGQHPKANPDTILKKLGTETFNQWVVTLVDPLAPVITLDTTHQPLYGHEDKWTFAQGDDLEITGVLTYGGKPVADAKVNLILRSPNRAVYNLEDKRSVQSAGRRQKRDLAKPLKTNDKGEFTWQAFFAPHAALGTWTIKASASFSLPDKKEVKQTATISQEATVVEDPSLTANQIRENFNWIQHQWAALMPAAGPIQNMNRTNDTLAWMAGFARSCPAQVGIGYKPRTWGPLNNYWAGMKGQPFIGFTCGGLTVQTLNVLNNLRFNDQEAIRKRFLGIHYLPVTHWPSTSYVDALYTHVAVMLYYNGYSHLGMASPPKAQTFSYHAFGSQNKWLGGIHRSQLGYTTPANAVVFEYWQNQQPDIMSASSWVDAFTLGHLGLPGTNWGYTCPVPDWETIFPDRLEPLDDYTAAKLTYRYQAVDKTLGTKTAELLGIEGKPAYNYAWAMDAPAMRTRARRMEILTMSPVTVQVKDAEGLRLGVTQDSMLVQEIPFSSVEWWPGKDGTPVQRLILPAGDFEIEVSGWSEGKFGLYMVLPGRQTILHYPKEQALVPGQIARIKLPKYSKGADMVMPDGSTVKPYAYSVPPPELLAKAADYNIPEEWMLMDAGMDTESPALNPDAKVIAYTPRSSADLPAVDFPSPPVKQTGIARTQTAREQQPVGTKPVVLQQRAEHWNGSNTDYARVIDHHRFEVGNGKGKFGFGFVGFKLPKTDNFTLTLDALATDFIRNNDGNSFAGLIIDYHTATGYSKRVALGFGWIHSHRWAVTPASWGAARRPDALYKLPSRMTYHLNLAQWAPTDWDGQVWVSAGIQNTGPDTKISGSFNWFDNSRQPTPATIQPRVLRQYGEHWSGSDTDYAKTLDFHRFEVGNGAGSFGFGFAGFELSSVNDISLHMDAPLTQFNRDIDGNSFAGVVIDYHTEKGYTKRIALGFGWIHKSRWAINPATWGTKRKPDAHYNLGLGQKYRLRLAEWAPPGWDGQAWITAGLQNTGANTTMSGRFTWK